jgi:hypothetical protein
MTQKYETAKSIGYPKVTHKDNPGFSIISRFSKT